MGGRILSGAFGFLGLALLIGVATSPANGSSEVQLPSVGWLGGKAQGGSGSPSTELSERVKERAASQPAEPAKPSARRVEPSAGEPRKPAKAAAAAEPANAARPLTAKSEAAKAAPVVAKADPGKASTAKAVPATPKGDRSKAELKSPEADAAKVEPAAAVPTPSKPEPPAAPAHAATKGPAKAEAAKVEQDGKELTGTLEVTSNPAGAALFLDGANIGQTPMEIDISTGSHKVRVISPYDGTDRSQSASVKPKETTRVDFTF